MTVTVKSDRPLTDIEQNQIIDIMQISQCPNESLINSIKECHGIHNNVITIGLVDGYIYDLTY